LHSRGLRYRVDFAIRTPEIVTRPDIVFRGTRVVVFVDGCFWHSCPAHGQRPRANAAYWTPKLAANVARDARANRALAADGWEVVRVWEHEDIEAAAAKIESTVRRRLNG
jgi:DNA mismatch endonuclease (patch repair protein)